MQAPLTRQLGLALIFFLMWATAAACAQLWLGSESRRVAAEALEAKQAQLEHAITLAPQTPEGWDEDFCRALGQTVGASLTVETATAAPPATPSGKLRFARALPGDHDRRLVVTFEPSRGDRLALMHQRMLAALALLALVFVGLSVLLAMLQRSSENPGEERPMRAARAEMHALEKLARVSVEQTEALQTESGARRRAEQNLELSQTLLDHSIENRVRLGRDLHDNLCQTIYAVTLNLESVRRRLRQHPDEAEANLTHCMQELRAANREVRAFIAGLTPSAVRHQSFVEGLEGMLASLGNLAGVRFDQEVDAEAAGMLTPAQETEALNIVREAVSNAVRHGSARTVTVQVRHDGRKVVLAVRDDGGGFDPEARRVGGHGLDNMHARAGTVGGNLRIISKPSEGTHVSLVLPVLLP